MPIRTALPAAVTISKADGTEPFTIAAHALGDTTNIAPGDQSQAVLAGYSRPSGAPFDVTVMAFESSHFDTLDAWQVAGELLNVEMEYDDGSTKTAKNVGFTVSESTPPGVGSFDGWTLTGTAQGASVPQALDISPAY